MNIIPTAPALPIPADVVEGGSPRPDSRLYSLKQAARLAQLCPPTAKRWITGAKHWNEGAILGGRRSAGAAYRPAARLPDLTFREMLTLRVVRGLREAGLTMPAVRRVAFRAAAEFGSQTPLVTMGFRRHGARIVLAMEDAERAIEDPEAFDAVRAMNEVDGWHRVFTDLVEFALFANVEWQNGLPSRWWPMGRQGFVLVDPDSVGGAPHVGSAQIPTAVIAAVVQAAGGDQGARAAVAATHAISMEQVHAAVFFEQEWLTTTRRQKWVQPPFAKASGKPASSSTATPCAPAWKRPMRVTGTPARAADSANAASRAAGTASSTS
jgi:hypothetical protein